MAAAGVNLVSLAPKQGVPHLGGLLLGNWIVAVVQDVAVPHADAPQAFTHHGAGFGTYALRVIVPDLMNLPRLVLQNRETEKWTFSEMKM